MKINIQLIVALAMVVSISPFTTFPTQAAPLPLERFVSGKLAPRFALQQTPASTSILPAPAAATAQPAVNPPVHLDVIYVPTPQTIVDKMLEMAEIKPGDVLYDLGCGDGRIMVTAAKKFGIKTVGYDIDPARVREAIENARTNGVAHLVTVKQEDIFQLDLREATVVTMFLLPTLNVRLMPQLKLLKPGSRIISHAWDMKGAQPVQVYRMRPPSEAKDASGRPVDGNEEHPIYKWIVPWQPETNRMSLDTPMPPVPMDIK
jgi:SAM-dependent methyltransferase